MRENSQRIIRRRSLARNSNRRSRGHNGGRDFFTNGPLKVYLSHELWGQKGHLCLAGYFI